MVVVQQSLTSERPYQRVILLVDGSVATSRRHWSAFELWGVVSSFLEGSFGGVRMPGCIPGNDYRKTTGSFDGRNPAWRTWQPHRLQFTTTITITTTTTATMNDI